MRKTQPSCSKAIDVRRLECRCTVATHISIPKIVRKYPLGRIGQPTDIAPTIAFLASEGAGWITGQVMSINGGYSMVG